MGVLQGSESAAASAINHEAASRRHSSTPPLEILEEVAGAEDLQATYEATWALRCLARKEGPDKAKKLIAMAPNDPNARVLALTTEANFGNRDLKQAADEIRIVADALDGAARLRAIVLADTIELQRAVSTGDPIGRIHRYHKAGARLVADAEALAGIDGMRPETECLIAQGAAFSGDKDRALLLLAKMRSEKRSPCPAVHSALASAAFMAGDRRACTAETREVRRLRGQRGGGVGAWAWGSYRALVIAGFGPYIVAIFARAAWLMILDVAMLAAVLGNAVRFVAPHRRRRLAASFAIVVLLLAASGWWALRPTS